MQTTLFIYIGSGSESHSFIAHFFSLIKSQALSQSYNEFPPWSTTQVCPAKPCEKMALLTVVSGNTSPALHISYCFCLLQNGWWQKFSCIDYMRKKYSIFNILSSGPKNFFRTPRKVHICSYKPRD